MRTRRTQRTGWTASGRCPLRWRSTRRIVRIPFPSAKPITSCSSSRSRNSAGSSGPDLYLGADDDWRSVTKARDAERRGIDRRGLTCRQIRGEAPCSRPNAEPVTGEPGGYDESRHGTDGADVGHDIGSDIYIAGPLLHDGHRTELRVEPDHRAPRLLVQRP